MHIKKIVLAVAACILIPMPLSAEYVFLKDGVIIEGTITSDTAGSYGQNKREQNRPTPRSNIMRILYTELYIGKVYVQLHPVLLQISLAVPV